MAQIMNAGLCASCLHRHLVHSAKGSTFVMCLRHREPGSTYAKYPRLPVLNCGGYTAADRAPSPPPKQNTG